MTARMNQGADLADRLLRNAAGIKGRRAKIVENDGGGSPVGDERQHHRRGDHNANAIVAEPAGLYEEMP